MSCKANVIGSGFKHSLLACAFACFALGGLWADVPGNSPTNAVQDVREEEEKVDGGFVCEPGSGISWGEQSLVSAEASLALDSKYLSYGFVDNDDPILTPSASLTLLDWLTFDVSAIFDMTAYGRKKVDGEHIYANRAGRYSELDPGASVGHSFGEDDFDWLPTTVEFSFGYMYEYYSRSYKTGADDTQYVSFEMALPDLWLEPAFEYNRDIVRDNGTYLNLELGHTFPLIDGDGEEDDALVSLRPSIAQGFGNAQRVKGYLSTADGEPLDHAGMMDTLVKLELTWNVASWFSISGYAAYSDFLFDRKIRECSRIYEASGHWDESWNFIGGFAVTATF